MLCRCASNRRDGGFVQGTSWHARARTVTACSRFSPNHHIKSTDVLYDAQVSNKHQLYCFQFIDKIFASCARQDFPRAVYAMSGCVTLAR